MRKFCSYGPVDTDLHYYVLREALIQQAYTQLVGEVPQKGGHYITVWAPRQRGKTWVMQQVKREVQQRHADGFAVLDFSLGRLRELSQVPDTETFPPTLCQFFKQILPGEPLVDSWNAFYHLFAKSGGVWQRPLILLIDEVDTLPSYLLDLLVAQLRELYLYRETNWLHGVALIGVRAVLGVENQSGSPFNVQRSLHIPNLTEAEVNEMYHWYERESGQTVEQAVIDRVYYETRGQPGLVSWLGELLTETYNETPAQPLTVKHFERVYNLALHALPNNNLLNIVSKARQSPYKATVLELFRTEKEATFRYEDPQLNFLYLNGVIDWEERPGEQGLIIKFPCPFVQKRLFHYFAGEIAYTGGRLYDPFDDLSDTITEDTLNVPMLLRRCETYFRENRVWLFKDAPRRADLRLYEAVYHFNLYAYVRDFLHRRGQVFPEFPTGNGKVDLIIRYAGQMYIIEVKSFTNAYDYGEALGQAAHYAQQLALDEITLALFIDTHVDDANRAKYEAVHEDTETGVTVRPVFVETREMVDGSQ